MRTAPSILLTGATGVLGRGLLARGFAGQVTGLVHNDPGVNLGIECIQGDVALPRLGLSPDSFRDLARDIDCIVHAGGLTSFGSRQEDLLKTNVQGTANVLDFAARANASFYYVSTAFVAARSQLPPNSAYDQSKREAEALVKATAIRATTIIRPSIIVGDSQTGWIPRFQGIHTIAAAVVRGTLPIFPAPPDAYIDFLPLDVVSDLVVGLVESNLTGEYWLTAGHEALRLAEIIEVCHEFASHVGRPISRLRFVDADIVDRLIRPAFGETLPAGVGRSFKRLGEMAEYANIIEPLPSSVNELKARFRTGPYLDLKTAFWNNLNYWAEMTGFPKRRGQNNRAKDPPSTATEKQLADRGEAESRFSGPPCYGSARSPTRG